MIILIKIITAIGNPNLNYALKKYEDFEVIGKDIQYSEGVVELLDLNKEIDYIIISEFIEGEITLTNLIEKIYKINKKIKIIIILNEKNIDLEEKLLQKGVHDIFYNKSDIVEIVNLLKTKNMEYLNKELRDEIEKLKNIILEKNQKKYLKRKNYKENIKYKILGILGSNGIGKTSFCYFISNILKIKYKILLIDFDLKNNDLSELFKLKKEFIEKENISIKNLIKNIDNNLDILFNINFLINYKKFDITKILNEINIIKENYDLIILDTNSNIFLEKNKEIFNFCEQLILLTSTDDLEIKKLNIINNSLINNLKIDNKKINIIIYKFKKIYCFTNKKNIKNLKNKIKNKINFMTFYNKYLINTKLIKLKYFTQLKYFLVIKNIQEK